MGGGRKGKKERKGERGNGKEKENGGRKRWIATNHDLKQGDRFFADEKTERKTRGSKHRDGQTLNRWVGLALEAAPPQFRPQTIKR